MQRFQSLLSRGLWASMALSVICLAQAATANAADMRILRIVNDEPISSYDVSARVNFVSVTSRSALTEQARQKVGEQVLETLIDEQLQLQEASRLGIKVADDEIQAAVARIETNNGMAQGQLMQLLTSRNVDANTLVNQIRSTLAWRKAVQRRLQSQVTISEDDIDAYLQGLREKGGTEYLLGEIFVAANQPEDLPRAARVARELASQLRGGSAFPELARQFSQAPTASTGGDTGWVRAEQLDRALADAVKLLQPGQVTPPLEVSDGYYILALRDLRQYGADGQKETVLDIRRVFLRYPSGAGNQQKRNIRIRANRLRQNLRSCKAIEDWAANAGDPRQGTLGEVRLTDLPEPLRPFISKLKAGEKTPVLRLPDGALVLMLCGKRTRSLGLPSREDVQVNLVQREADILARRYLRELRQNAIIQSFEDQS